MKKFVFLLFGVLMFAACGGDDATDSATQQVTYEPTATSAPVTEMPQEAQETAENEADAQTDEAVVDNYPKAIVSLSPTATEMLFAIGAGDQVIAVDNYSYWPPQAPVIDDLSGFNPNVEAIAAFGPDLVVLSDSGVQEELELLGIDVFVAAAAVDLEDVYTQIGGLGDATGNANGAI